MDETELNTYCTKCEVTWTDRSRITCPICENHELHQKIYKLKVVEDELVETLEKIAQSRCNSIDAYDMRCIAKEAIKKVRE